MFKPSWHEIVIKMVDHTCCKLILCNKDIEALMEEREDRSTRILKVEWIQDTDDNKKYTDYLNKDLIRDIEVY